MTKNVRIADFFAGVGGIRLGFEEASDQYCCVFTNEIDKFAIRTYEENFPSDKVNNTPIENLNPSIIPDFDVFLGGFPCQSFSLAGNRQGFDDERGNLFFSIINILNEKQPQSFLLENVKNLHSHDNGKTFSVIKTELCNLGYSFTYKIMNSCEYGNVPQNRERIFLVGFKDLNKTVNFRFPKSIKLTTNIVNIVEERVSDVLYYKETDTIYPLLLEENMKHVKTNTVYQFRRHYIRENKSSVCPTLTANMGTGGHNVPIIKDNVGIRKLSARECFRLQGFNDDFKLPCSNAQSYKQAGNSVTVSVIKSIAVNMLKTIRGEKYHGEEGIIISTEPKIVYEN